MKYIRTSLILLLTLFFLMPATLMAQEIFNPGNPPSPGSIFRLTVVSNMPQAGIFTLMNAVGDEVASASGTSLVAEVPAGELVYLAISNVSENITIKSVETSDGTTLNYNGVVKGYELRMPNHGTTVTVNFGTAQPIIPNSNYFDAGSGTLHLDYFAPGNAYNVANNAMGSKTVSVLRVAGPTTDADYKVATSSWTSCSLIDYSRTNGGRIVPKWSFSSLKALNAVILPACVDSIAPQAFSSCTALASITCFAMVPPRVPTKSSDTPFYSCKALETIFVPREAVGFYRADEVWGKYDIQPINEGIVTLEVSLPEECKDGRCQGLYMELKDTKSGYAVTYLCNERLKYTFYYLPNNADYHIRLYEKNANPQVECAAMDIPVKEDDIKVTLENVRYKKHITVRLFDSDDIELPHSRLSTAFGIIEGFANVSCNIEIGESHVLSGKKDIFWYEGETIRASITNVAEMFAQYNQLPDKKIEYVIPHEDESDFVIKFAPLDLRQYTLSGYVKDANTGLPISGANISAVQNINKLYTKRLSAETNGEGFFSMDLYMRDIAELTVSAKNYQSLSLKPKRHDVAEGETVTLDDITMDPNVTVFITYNYKEASVDGGKAASFEPSNLTFGAKNLTTGEKLTCLQTSSNSLIIDEAVNVGDELDITINSTANVFDPVDVTGIVTAGHHMFVTADIVQRGGISAKVKTTENKELVAMLFDIHGSLVDKYPMTSASIDITMLPIGRYSLVMMGRSDLYNSFNMLEQFAEAGLAEGKDYVKQTVTVESGRLSETSFALVPFFEDNRERYLSSSSYFNTMARASAGSYITLYANTAFDEAYKYGAKNVTLDITIPLGLQYVAGTAMTAPVGAESGKLIPGAKMEGTTLHIPLTTPAYAATPLTRLCVLPEFAGNYTMTACVRFEYKGLPITAPLGEARLEVQDMGLTIDVNDEINSKKFEVTGSIGTAYVSHAAITIYDNDTPIGSAHIKNGGGWTAECELKTAYNLSKHNIYAMLKVDGVYAAQSEVKEVTYNIDSENKLSQVNMFYYNIETKKQFVVKFDYVTKEKPDAYTWYVDNKNYDFVVDFIENDPEKITDVQLYAMDTHGDWHEVETSWNERRNSWIGSFTIKGDKPIINVAVEYNYLGQHRMDEYGVKMYASGLDVTYKKSEEEKENLKAVVDEIQKDVAEADKKYQQAQEILNRSDENWGVDNIDDILNRTKDFNSLYGIEVSSDEVSTSTSYEEWQMAVQRLRREAEELLAAEDDFDDDAFDAEMQQQLNEMLDVEQLIEKISDDEYRISFDGFTYSYKKCKLSDVDLSIYFSSPMEYTATDGKKYKKYVGEGISCFVDVATGDAWIEEMVAETDAPLSARKKGFWDNLLHQSWETIKKKLQDAAKDIDSYASKAFATMSVYKEAVEKEIAALTESVANANKEVANFAQEIEKNQKVRDQIAKELENLRANVKTVDDKFLVLGKETDFNKLTSDINYLEVDMKRLEANIAHTNNRLEKLKSKISFDNKNLAAKAKLAGQLLSAFSLIKTAVTFGVQIRNDFKDGDEWQQMINSIPDPCPEQQEWADDLREHLKNLWDEIWPVYLASDISAGMGFALNILSSLPSAKAVAGVIDMVYDLIVKALADSYHESAVKRSATYRRNNQRAIDELKCYKDDDPNNPGGSGNGKGGYNPNNTHPGGGSKVVIDPSGYVFEAVTDNRVMGATATIYYREKDKQTNEWNEVLWNAAEYAQQNPLFTDADGMYRWDVPVGEWQVRINKDGYNETRSEWLPVPPPQLDVNLPLVSYEQPEVVEAHAYKDGVEMTFSKYMDPAYFNTSNIYITTGKDDKRQVLTDLSIEPLDAKAVSEADATTYARQWFFKTEQDLSQMDEAIVTVRPRVQSYAGIPLSTAFSQALDIEERVKELLADSVYYVPNDQSTTIKVAALPANSVKGRKMTVTTLALAKMTLGDSSAPDFVGDTQEVVFDENGEASFTVNALLPGITGVNYAIEGTTMTGHSVFSVIDPSMIGQEVAAPKASRISGTELYRGQTITLTADSKDAVIYYTLDGSCPCDNTKRMVYKNPITVNQPVTIKAMAVAKDMTESEISTFNYGIRQTSLDLDFAKGWNWASHNSEEALSVKSIAENTLVVRTEQGESQLTDVGVKGNVNEVEASEAMKVQASAATTHHITGDEYNPSAQLISLHEGWNWLGYPLSQTMSISEALSFLDADEGDVICSPDGFATFEGGKWDGSLTLLAPGKGYLYKSNATKSFVYNNTIVSVAKAREAGGMQKAATWIVDKYAYPNVMCVAATIDIENMPTAEGEYVVAAFSGDECRGIAESTNGTYYLTVYGNQGEPITFCAVSADKNVHEFLNKEAFKADILGSRSVPYVLTHEVSGIDAVEAHNAKNTSVYDVVGRRVNSVLARPGIYISGGKKVVTK